MKSAFRFIWILSLLLVFCGTVWTVENGEKPEQDRNVKAAIIECEGLIDDGLYQSIKRRSALALEDGADYIILSIATYGGLVQSADDISKFLILELADEAHTVAYVKEEAISAGAMISVSCNDIIMSKNTNIGDSAPIVMGQKLEGVEREKTESFIRSIFARAAQANDYPQALLEAMVTSSIEVYRIKNLETGEYEFFESEFMPVDPNMYALDESQLIVIKGEILTLTAKEAYEYGIARAVVEDVEGALSFLEQRDNVEFAASLPVYETSWSEEMVRWLNSPGVTGILFMVGLLGLYIEFNTPGIGLPGLAAVICFVILFGSKFLVDLANWVEIAVFILGIVLLAIEIFVIPGFGIAGAVGTACLLAGLVGILVKNSPDELPIPKDAVDWYYLRTGALGLSFGFIGFIVLAWIVSRFLPRMGFFSPLVLNPYKGDDTEYHEAVVSSPETTYRPKITVGDTGQVVKKLRPAGEVRFGDAIVDVVSDGEFIDTGIQVKIIQIYGNRVVVAKVKTEEQG